MVALLIVEQFVAAWWATFRGRISLAAMLVLMAASGVFFSLMRKSVAITIWIFVALVILVSAALEDKRRRPVDASPPVDRKDAQ